MNAQGLDSHPVFRALLLLIGAACIALTGTVTGWRIAGPTESETTLGRVSFEVAPHLTGGVDAFVPVADWGIRADSFDAPFQLEVEVRAVDRRGAVAAAGGGGSTLRELERELEAGARSAIARAFLWGLGATVVLALLVSARRTRWLRRAGYLGVAFSVLAAGGALALAAATFDSKRFADPSFYGRGAELGQLLAFFERESGGDRYASGFDDALANFSAYLSDAPRPEAKGGQAFLFVSDVHSNAPILTALERFGDGEPVLIAGDFAHEGSDAEARLLVPRIEALDRRVIAVSGNHDSQRLMQELAGAGVTVLEQDGRLDENGDIRGSPLLDVGGVTIAGFSDPLEWEGEDPSSPKRIFSFPELDDGGRLEAQAKADLVRWYRSLPEQPDIVLVHQNGLAQHLASALASDGYDRPLTIVTGHNHLQQIDRHGAVLVVNAGTLGAGGLLGLGQESAGVGLLHLERETAAAQSVDLIRIEPLSGQAQADRVVVEIVCPADEAGDDPCHYEPEGF